jgi:tetratricopeptide (TPR) repeat protein
MQGAVRVFLEQALRACGAGDVDLMIKLATSARWISVECNDTMGEAAALIHLGVAFLSLERMDDAQRAFGWASRTLHRSPEWRQRFNEGIALFGLGLALQSSSPPRRLKAIAQFQQALELLESVRENYWSSANDQKVLELDHLANKARAYIFDQVPLVYVDVAVTVSLDDLATDTLLEDAPPIFRQDKDAAWTEEFRRDAPGDIESVDLES